MTYDLSEVQIRIVAEIPEELLKECIASTGLNLGEIKRIRHPGSVKIAAFLPPGKDVIKEIIVGFASGMHRKKIGKEFILDVLYVPEMFRRRGIGRRLFSGMVKEAQKRGFTLINSPRTSYYFRQFFERVMPVEKSKKDRKIKIAGSVKRHTL